MTKVADKMVESIQNLSNSLTAKPKHYDSRILIRRIIPGVQEIGIKRKNSALFLLAYPC